MSKEYDDGWYEAIQMVLEEIDKIKDGYNNVILDELKQRIV
jgi:hypothetical protein